MADTPTPQQVTRNISLDTDTDALVTAHDDLLGLNNYSAAIRVIVREWARMKSAITPTTPTKQTRKANA